MWFLNLPKNRVVRTSILLILLFSYLYVVVFAVFYFHASRQSPSVGSLLSNPEAHLSEIGGRVSTLPSGNDADDIKLSDVDAIIVLTGGIGRIAGALRLYKAGFGQKLLISGVDTNANKKDIANTLEEGLREVLFEDNVILGKIAADTKNNALEALFFIKANNYKNVLLVTSDYHFPRVSLLFNHAFKDYNITFIPGVVRSMKMTSVFSECNKYTVTYLSYFLNNLLDKIAHSFIMFISHFLFLKRFVMEIYSYISIRFV